MEKSSADNLIQSNLAFIRKQVDEAARDAGRNPADIRIMAVTKTIDPVLVNTAIGFGVNLLGENRAQELLSKVDSYNLDGVEVHFIGRLQTNKVRQIVDKVTMIHSVDSLKLAQEISRRSESIGKTMDILLEVNVGDEAAKGGIPLSRAEELARQIALLPSVSVRGLMVIPPICDEESRITGYFSQIQQLSVDIKAKNIDNMSMDILSMGMSGDFIPAIRCGSNIIRLGTALFGNRQYR